MYERWTLDAASQRVLQIPPGAPDPDCELAADGTHWLLFYPARALAIWRGPAALSGFPAASLAEALDRLARGDTENPGPALAVDPAPAGRGGASHHPGLARLPPIAGSRRPRRAR